jgi:hypothetical protein
MHYVKEVDQNLPGQRNPMLRHYFIYGCAICGNEKEFDYQLNFDKVRLRKCPNCGVTDDTNNIEALIKRKQELEQQITQLNEELTKIDKEIGRVQDATHPKPVPEKV